MVSIVKKRDVAELQDIETAARDVLAASEKLMGCVGDLMESMARLKAEADKNDYQIERLKESVSDLKESLLDAEDGKHEVLSAAVKVVELAGAALGAEDALAETSEMFSLRRALEDLKGVC